MKILIIRNAAPHDFGGGERFPIYLAQELQACGLAPVIVSRHAKILALAAEKQLPAVRGWWWGRQNWSGRRIIGVPLYFLWQAVLTLWYIRLIIKHKANIVHPQSKDDFIAATLAAALLHKRVIWTDHADLKYICQNGRVWYKNPIGKLVAWCSRFANAITVVSGSERQLIAEALGRSLPGKYQVIYNGITDHPVTALPREPADAKATVFCATSRLVTAKGIGELIAAFKALKKRYDNPLRLWLLGEGPEEAAFRRQAGDDEDIAFLGFPSTSLNILKSADIFVHPSYHEGFSLSLIEAAMLGRPIIACDAGGNPEIIADGQNGQLIPPRDVDALQAAMQRYLDDPALATRHATAARTTYERQFRFDIIVKEQFLPLYE